MAELFRLRMIRVQNLPRYRSPNLRPEMHAATDGYSTAAWFVRSTCLWATASATTPVAHSEIGSRVRNSIGMAVTALLENGHHPNLRVTLVNPVETGWCWIATWSATQPSGSGTDGAMTRPALTEFTLTAISSTQTMGTANQRDTRPDSSATLTTVGALLPPP